MGFSNYSLLLVFPHNPFLLQNGAHARFLGLIQYFYSRKASIDILSHSHFVDSWAEYDSGLVNSLYLNDFRERYSFYYKVLLRIKKFFNSGKCHFESYAHSSLTSQFKSLTKKKHYDIIIVSYVNWAELVADIDDGDTKTILMIEDFVSLNNYERCFGNYLLGDSIEKEIQCINYFDKAICISKDEMSFFQRFCKKTEFYHIPHFLDFKHLDIEKKIDIAFVGSDNPFNLEGIIWFLEEVMPFVGQVYKIKIVGRVCDYLAKYDNQYKNVEFIRYVENLDDIYSKSKITICPLLGGTGLKIKVVESLSYSIPVVSTKYGVIGMDDKNNGCLVADSPDGFANSIKLLLENSDVYCKLVVTAKEYFFRNFSRESAYKKLDKVFFD